MRTPQDSIGAAATDKAASWEDGMAAKLEPEECGDGDSDGGS